MKTTIPETTIMFYYNHVISCNHEPIYYKLLTAFTILQARDPMNNEKPKLFSGSLTIVYD